ncbi:MAG: hypothetical protein ABIC04_03310 [Nanoarchaeota archaeon]
MKKKLFIIELGFVVALLLVFYLAFLTYHQNMQSVYNLQTQIFGKNMPTQPTPEFTQKLANEIDSVKSVLGDYINRLISTTILYFTILIMIIAYFNGLAFSIIKKVKFRRKMFINLSAVLFIWTIFWILLLAIIIFGIKNPMNAYFAIAWLIAAVYFSLLLLPIFIFNKKIVGTIKETFRLGIACFYRYLAVLIVAGIVFLAVIILSIAAINYLKIAGVLIAISGLLSYLVYLRIYMVEFVGGYYE